jgi:hypothetical protein
VGRWGEARVAPIRERDMAAKTLLFAALGALVARYTVFADGDTTEAFISFAVFWALAGSWVAAVILS